MRRPWPLFHAAFSPRSHSVDLPVSAPAGKPTYMAQGGGIGDLMAASSRRALGEL